MENNEYKELLKELADYLYSITYNVDFNFLHENAEYEVKEILTRVYEKLEIKDWDT
jgi:hypothetical protein